MKRVSIIIPWIRRDGWVRCLDAIYAGAQVPPHCYEIVTMEDADRIGVPRMVARLVEKAEFDSVMFLADDTVPQPGFLLESLKVLEALPQGYGVVALNDGIHNGNLATHWLSDKRLLPEIGGYFFNPAYSHGYCDSELTLRAKQLGRYAYAQKAVIEHLHPHRGVAPWDKDYLSVYSHERLQKDYHTFLIRKRKGWPL